MGSGLSKLYLNAHGSSIKSSENKIRLECQAYALHKRFTSWAKRKSNSLGKISKRQRDKFNTACVVIDKETGKRYYGRDNEN